MKLIQSINFIEDKRILLRLNLVAVPLTLGFYFLFYQLSLLNKTPAEFSGTIVATLLLLVWFFILITVHELIHGLFFKFFNPEGTVKFGFKNGAAYATSPHSYYSKGQFSVIGLSPFILLTIFLSILYFTNLLSDFSFIILASVHAAGCVGDFYLIYLLLKSPKGALVEDTEQGINFYLKKL